MANDVAPPTALDLKATADLLIEVPPGTPGAHGRQNSNVTAHVRRHSGKVGAIVDRYVLLRRGGKSPDRAMCSQGILTETGCSLGSLRNYRRLAIDDDRPAVELLRLLNQAEEAILVEDGRDAMDVMKRQNPAGYYSRMFPAESRATDDEMQRAKFQALAGDVATDLHSAIMESCAELLGTWCADHELDTAEELLVLMDDCVQTAALKYSE